MQTVIGKNLNIIVIVTLADLKEFANDLEKDKEREKLLNTRIVDCNLSVRTIHILKGAGVQTIGDILKYNRSELLCIKNLGKRARCEIEDFLFELGLELK